MLRLELERQVYKSWTQRKLTCAVTGYESTNYKIGGSSYRVTKWSSSYNEQEIVAARWRSRDEFATGTG